MLFLVRLSSRNKKSHLMPIKPTTLLCFIYWTIFLPLFYFVIPTRIFTSLVPLISHPALFSTRFLILNSYLSLPATEGNKILLLWKLLTERRESAYETSSVETEAYIWPFPVGGLGGGFNLLWTLCLFSCVKNYQTDGVTDRVRKTLGKREGETERERETKRQEERCMEFVGLVDIDH